jgi:hypothetical protein
MEEMMPANRTGTMLAIMLVTSWRVPSAQPADRATDRDVVYLIENIDRARGRFEAQLDAATKSRIVQVADRQISVERYLTGFGQNVKALKDRFGPNQAANKEAETVLRQASDIDTAVKAQPEPFAARTEWDLASGDLVRLAAAYSTDFPLPPIPTVRRINDADVIASAQQMAKAADQLKKQIGLQSSLLKTTRDVGVRNADDVVRQAKALAAHVSSAKSGTVEGRALLRATNALAGFMLTMPAGSGATATWASLQPSLEKVRQAYGTVR